MISCLYATALRGVEALEVEAEVKRVYGPSPRWLMLGGGTSSLRLVHLARAGPIVSPQMNLVLKKVR